MITITVSILVAIVLLFLCYLEHQILQKKKISAQE